MSMTEVFCHCLAAIPESLERGFISYHRAFGKDFGVG